MFDFLLAEPGWIVLLLVGLVVFAEDALFVGFVIPGEAAAILGGVAASMSHVGLAAVLVTVTLAAVVGDSVGYAMGLAFGPRLLALKAVQRHRAGVEHARDVLAHKGGVAVFIGRWTAFLRAVTPALAGMSQMPYRTFLPWNAAGGVAWSVVVVVAGFLAGHSYRRVETWFGRGGAVLAVAAVIVVVGVVLWRRRRGDEG